VSPLSLRRYRAERLLREDFDRLRGSVIARVRGQLRSRGVGLDAGDLEACYAQAWHGLYTTVLDGQEIANPAGWLALVTFRRAIDEHRTRERTRRASEQPTPREHTYARTRRAPRSTTSRPRSMTASSFATCSRRCADA
jgi:DNA-directed RNA polymerase specialized sigma24 family protein